ncbi:MAG TPA: nucleoside phosphorylase [Acidimicrobiales bacterium]|jgi:uridine phosphorylase
MSIEASSFPNFPDKHSGSPLVRPEIFLRGLLDRDDVVVPKSIIMGYSGQLPAMLEDRGFTRVDDYRTSWRALWLREGPNVDRVGVVEGFGYGAPAAAIVFEELATLGARRFINLGMAGALPSEIGFGQVVLCTAAVRDEGVSHHYVPTARYAYPSPVLTEDLRQELRQRATTFVEGPTWTIDAIYRETVDEAMAYRDEGVITVDMESAALFTIAQMRDVELAAIFAVSDHLLAGDEWQLSPDRSVVTSGLASVLDAALAVLDVDRP